VADDSLDAGRDVPVGHRQIKRIFFQNRRHGLAGRVAAKRAMAREHLVEDRPQREDVASRVGGFRLDLLGRHVPERSHDDAWLGRGRKARDRCGSFRLRQLGQAEVEDLDAAFLRHEDVFGLQIAMDDPLLVRRGQALRDLDGVVDRPARRESAARELRPQCLAFEELLHDVGAPS
jgi:hypothetical protein